jgi:hypothetical protein
METGDTLGLGPLKEDEQLVVERLCSCPDYVDRGHSLQTDSA